MYKIRIFHKFKNENVTCHLNKIFTYEKYQILLYL